MSAEEERQSAAVRAWHMVMKLWDEAEVQIDDSCRMIKLSVNTFSQLKSQGRTFFAYRCSTLLGKPAEFLLDHSNKGRVYLGNPEDIERALDSVVIRKQGYMPTLYRRSPPKYASGTDLV